MSEASGLWALETKRAAGPAALLLQRLLRRLDYGRLTITLPDGTCLAQRGAKPGTEAQLVLHNWRPLRALLLRGDNGFSESYFAGDWSSPDLAAFLRFGAENMAAFDEHAPGSLMARLVARLRHWANRNSRIGSRRNIMAHYDLGNHFYAQWLDASMTYSAALYESPEDQLETAQARKLARIAALLQAGPGADILEIGCGWGALAEHLAADGARVTGLTLSPAQAGYARAQLAMAGLSAHTEIALRDYRDETGQYSHIVSIEMLEAVGEDYWPTYFATLREKLRPGGRAVLQIITIAEDRFEGYRRTPDFIQRHVFPGGMLPTKTIIAAQVAQAGLALTHTEFFGEGYRLTLAAWRQRFLAAWPAIAQDKNFTPRFRRLWEYYLAYCEAGFATFMTDVGFYVLERGA